VDLKEDLTLELLGATSEKPHIRHSCAGHSFTGKKNSVSLLKGVPVYGRKVHLEERRSELGKVDSATKKLRTLGEAA